MKSLLVLLAAGLVLVGCQGSESELKPEQDKELRNNLSRTLTPEEVAQMGGGKKEGATPATPPVKGN